MLLTRAAGLLATGVLIPLYIYPLSGPNCPSWARLISSIVAHPNVPFYAVINPQSGPDGAPGSQPTPEFRECIAALKLPNVRVLGYVVTDRGEAAAQAFSDVETYSVWGAAWRPDGIFFDQVAGTAALYSTYANLSAYARDAFCFVAMNPGAPPEDESYFDLADIVGTANTLYGRFGPQDLRISSSAPASKQALMLTDGPAAPPVNLIDELVRKEKVGAVWITDDTQANGQNPWDALPTGMEAFISAVEAAAS